MAKKRPEIPGIEILGKIGEGSQGIVLKGIMQDTKTTVAVKILSPKLAQVAEYRRRFAREMGVATQLDHPNIIKALKAGKIENTFYYVMEFAPGTDLNKLIEKLGALPEKKALHIAAQAADALKYAHGQGLIHRDIKPGNMIILKDWGLKILDLGLAKDSSTGIDLTMAGTIFGTANYISPEAIEDSKSVDARSDVYSLGATLYKMLTAVPPFDGKTPTVVMEKVLHEAVVPPRNLRPELSEGANRIVLKALEKHKEDRYASADAMLADIKRVMKGEKPLAGGPLKPTQRRPGAGLPKRGIIARLLSALGLGGGREGKGGSD